MEVSKALPRAVLLLVGSRENITIYGVSSRKISNYYVVHLKLI